MNTPPEDRGPGQHATASGFARIYQSTGDMAVYGAEEPYRLAAWPVQGSEPSVEKARKQPSVLLRAADGLIAFTGREAELRDLRVWRDAAASDTTRVHLIHAAGGQGKTRLAGHVASLWQREGWSVLAAHHRRDRSAPEVFVGPDAQGAAGVLVTVDYAERWDTSDLLTLLKDVQAGAVATGAPVRVLLLARPAGTWWQSLKGRIQRDVGLVPTWWELEPLEDGPSITRTGLFTSARDRFADLLGVPAAKRVDPPVALAGHDAYRMVLTVHMAAMAAVLGHGGETDPPVDPQQVSALLLGRERDHWEAMHAPTREKSLATTPDAMGQMVYLATLTGPLGYPDAKSAVGRVEVDSKEAVGQLLKDHGVCYPPAGGTRGPDRRAAPPQLQPLYPDRLGEDFVALLTPGHDHDFPADPWADGAPARLLTPEPDWPVWAAHALTTLVETAGRWPHLAQEQLFPLLTAHPRLALEATGAALAALVDLEDIDVELLRSIDALVPEHRNADLDVGIAALAVKLAAHNLADATSPAERARIHAALSVRLRNSGLHADALDANLQALDICRELAESGRQVHRRQLAILMGNHANLLAESGRSGAALRMSQPATELWLELSKEAPGAYEADLVTMMSNHANRLAEVGLRREAVALSEKALALCEELAAGDWDAHAESLGHSLNNHALWLSAVGRRDEAVPVSERALTVRRRLTALDRGAHSPDLVASLHNHGALLGKLRRLDEAMSISQETIDLERRLVEANRQGHLAPFAGTLSNRAILLAAQGRRHEAESPSEESIDLHRELVTVNRAAHLPGLAVSVNNHALLLRELDRSEDSVPFSSEAIDLHRELARVNPGAFLPRLAQGVTNHAALLVRLGRTDEAVPFSGEAQALWRRLVAVDRDLYLRELATSTNNHGVWLREQGRLDEAVPFSQEAISLYEEVAGAEPDTYLPILATSLRNLANLLTEMERWSEAELPASLAAGLHQQLVEADDSYLPGYLDTLADYGRVLIGARRFVDAIAPLAAAYPAALRLPEGGNGTVAVLVHHLRRAHAGDPVAVADRFRSVAGVDVPDWMKEPPRPM
ncbi:tetratricopeptide repeat protein [Streptomyces virginiae]|uniref:tetratricopeptide repeat protein n=1 Tax=Streptomyces virginiae TaxID=1961 RepID=UPI0022574E13|nr:tetratricopeptide repeat protein [Streptomyces virginiae]MCX4962581.1 tetratricopeptide repeat protein [Streptomyces virginiae]